METIFKEIIITPTAKNIEKQYQYIVKKEGYLLHITRFSLYYDTLTILNENKHKKDLTLKQLEILKDKKMINVKMVKVVYE